MKITSLVFSLMLLLNVSCNKKTAEKSSEMKDPAPEKKEFVVSEIESKMNMPDCLQEYADLDPILNMDGTIVMVMDMAMISYNSSSRINPCNIPDWCKEGDKVMFSGVIKESPKGVRLAGTPFKLSSIVKR